ncbi:MAG TPA: protein kinase, partial [Gemmatimonadales bacterium]|nr:protein kinase [Gemmatimonadales bacterium]
MRRSVMARERRALAPVHSALYSCDVTYTEPSLPDRFSRLRAALAKQYRLDRELGRGGMATVYLAHDLKHDRPVALKLLHPEIAAVLGSERFQREIMLAARLQHPHILAVHDSGEAAGELWFTMPFVEGEALRDRLEREHQLPVEDALRIARETAEALDYAHRHGIIHRDVKPENIMLTGTHALVADFGIARALDAETRLTNTGIAVGTPAYMSPEQASGARDLDPSSDVYSLASVLYEMLTGEPAFSRITKPRPVAGALDAVLRRALAVAPRDRYPSAADFARALEEAASAAAPWRRPPRPLFAMLLVGFLIGVGVLFAWRRSREGAAGGERVLAVLPFENLGSPEQEYFADGMTDEVRGKLADLAGGGLQVIGRASSTPFKRTTKTPQQIAQELGAQYLLTATVRWERLPGGGSAVHVSPELVQVRAGSGGAPTTKWQQSFDAQLTNVFQVQADIASRVAQSLDVALGATAQQQLAERPTANLAAYDAFLRGEALFENMAGNPFNLRRAVSYYEQAVSLDSTFAQAWAELSRSHSALYGFIAPKPADSAAAYGAAQRALALAPNSPGGHHAMGSYYKLVLGDNVLALEQLAHGYRLAPGRGDVLSALSRTEWSLGRWETALDHLHQAQRLDPRSVTTASGLGERLTALRRYDEAVQALDKGLAFAPANLELIETKAMVFLCRGDLAAARAVLQTVPNDVDPSALAAYLATYNDLMWVLGDAQQTLLLRLRPAAFGGDRALWGIVLAQTYALRGDTARMQAFADTARVTLSQRVQVSPHDPIQHASLALALAYLGRFAEAKREAERAVALRPIAQDADLGPYVQHQLVRIYILANEPEKALDRLEPLLK